MFIGEFQHTLDDKGRIILPARFRERLGSSLVLAPGQDRCLAVYPVTVFARKVEQMRRLPSEDTKVRAYKRTLLAWAEEATPDGQGRVTVPARLREYAGLDREVTIVGADEHLEVWDRERWEAYRVEAAEAFAALDAPLGAEYQRIGT